MSTDNNPFGITRDEVLNLCAEKILAQADEDIHDAIFSLVRERVNDKIGRYVQDAITDTLNKEMERILTSPITPVNIWGETAGKPTNIRDQLLQRAKLFFEESVDGDLRPAHYGGRPRYQRIYENLAQQEFNKAIATHVTEIAVSVKSCVRDNLWQALNSALNEKFAIRDSAPKTPPPAAKEGGSL